MFTRPFGASKLFNPFNVRGCLVRGPISMDELIKTFHIDWKLLTAQIINFAIVLLVLWRYALKPLMAMMDKRAKEIAKSLEDARKIEENLARAAKEKEEIIASAKKEAHNIIEQSRQSGSRQGQEMIEKAKEEVQQVISQAKIQIAQEKEKMLVEVKSEVSGLVVESTARILKEMAGETLDGKIINKIME